MLALRSKAIRDVVVRSLSFGYRMAPCDIDTMLCDFQRDLRAAGLDAAARRARERVLNDSGVRKRLERLAGHPKARRLMTMLGPEIRRHLDAGGRRPPVLLDIGCGGGAFLGELRRNVPATWRVHGSDVIDPRSAGRELERGVRFHLQRASDGFRVGLRRGSVDGIFNNFLLHHVDRADLEGLIRQQRELLRPGGILCVLEDSYDTRRAPRHSGRGLAGAFAALTEPQKRAYLAFIDFWSIRVVWNRPDMNQPFAFRSMAQWTALFGRFGFEPLKSVYSGFGGMRLHFNPEALMIFGRTADGAGRAQPARRRRPAGVAGCGG